jgi:ribosome-binding ATPase YchF (GTP1/OBG family)
VFFTANEKEAHAWTLRDGSTALQAAAEVHSDFARGFIKAEVVSWDRLKEAGSLAVARKAGTLRAEGKGYVVRDGDVIMFLFHS